MKSFKILSGVFLLGVALVFSSMASAEEYKIDNVHSRVGFSAKHLMVSKTVGSFKEYDGVIKFDPNDLAASKIDVTIQSASINTHMEKRDEHLKSPDFLDVAKFPTITFVTKSIAKEGDGYQLTGDLTLKGVTKEIKIPATISGPVNSPMGGVVIGIESNFKINRQDYGVSWNKAMDNGGFVVSDEVNIDVTIEADKK